MKIENDIKNGVEALIEAAKSDYDRWSGPNRNEHEEEMFAEYCEKIDYKPGSKYIKILTSGVHSFVVNTDKDKKFNRGDILKAASWNAPARNFARGNVLDGSLENVRWTGVN